MRPALLLFYLAALMVKTDVTSDDSHDQEAFGAFLIFVLFVGPSMAIVEPFFEFVRAAIRRAPSSRHHEEDTHQHFLSHIEIYYRGKLITVGEFENKLFSEVVQKEKRNEGPPQSQSSATSGAMWEAKKMEREEALRRKELRRIPKSRRESEIFSQRLREQLNTAAWKDESKGDTNNDQNDALQNVSLTTTMDTTVRDTTGEETGWVRHQRLHTSGRETRFSDKYNLNELNPQFLPLRGFASPNVSQRSHYASSRVRKPAFKAVAPNYLISPTARPNSLSEKVAFQRETILPTSATKALASETTMASKPRRRENSLDRIGDLWT